SITNNRINGPLLNYHKHAVLLAWHPLSFALSTEGTTGLCVLEKDFRQRAITDRYAHSAFWFETGATNMRERYVDLQIN
ncbi:MAG: hypothetical protein RSC17_09565, partial [Lachnospiraceae bacterium]